MTEERSPGAGGAVAVLATIAAGASLVLVRDLVHREVIALLLAATVVGFGLLGGRRVGVAAALAAAVSFNFFFTQPYLSLRIHDIDDVITTATLLAFGLMSGITAQVAGRRRELAEEVTRELREVGRVSELVASGADPEDVEEAVEAQLLDLLHLSGIARASSPAPGAAVLERSGNHGFHRLNYRDGGFELPVAGVAIPVHSDGSIAGYITCIPQPGAVASLAARRTAVVLADLLGASLAGATRRRTAAN